LASLYGHEIGKPVLMNYKHDGRDIFIGISDRGRINSMCKKEL
jgi:hypothetical protein